MLKYELQMQKIFKNQIHKFVSQGCKKQICKIDLIFLESKSLFKIKS